MERSVMFQRYPILPEIIPEKQQSYIKSLMCQLSASRVRRGVHFAYVVDATLPAVKQTTVLH